GNSVGYAGYIFNAEVPGGGGLYTVRYRHYDPGLGRWLERDPLGYVDGLSLFEYVMGNSVNAFDPFGLCAAGAAANQPPPIKAPRGPKPTFRPLGPDVNSAMTPEEYRSWLKAQSFKMTAVAILVGLAAAITGSTGV